MKKKNIINLIRYHAEGNDSAFRTEAYEIAQDFDKSGDVELAEYILAQLSSANTFIPQIAEDDLSFFKKEIYEEEPLPLPETIKDDIVGIINAIGHNVGINKFLFQGEPGTGKTVCAKQVAKILKRDLYAVDFNSVIDSKLGQTSKNIATLFEQMNNVSNPDKIAFLFDEIDAIAMDRTNSNDLREMGRATTAVLKGFDSMNEQIVLIATTNLFSSFDKALTRRFDTVIDFNRYTKQDLIEVAEILLDFYLDKFKFAGRNMRLFKKILNRMEKIPMPGELKNYLKISLAFSKANDEFDYLKRIYNDVMKGKEITLKVMHEQGFTVREIEILSGVSKSQVSREIM